jgi:hypothetical protein
VAGEVDECLEILRQSFVSNRFGAGACVPTYDSWFFEQSERDSYRRYVDVLRLIGAAEPRKRWLLKNPGHLAQMRCLLEVFPDACVVLTHRDPLKAIPSLCSTLHMARRMFEGETARAEVIGPRECRYWRQALDCAAEVRRSRPTQFFDVDHRRFVSNPLGTVRSIYAFFGLELSVPARERMQSWIAADPTSRHGQHHYNLENFGMTAQGLREQFADYRTEFGFH